MRVLIRRVDSKESLERLYCAQRAVAERDGEPSDLCDRAPSAGGRDAPRTRANLIAPRLLVERTRERSHVHLEHAQITHFSHMSHTPFPHISEFNSFFWATGNTWGWG